MPPASTRTRRYPFYITAFPSLGGAQGKRIKYSGDDVALARRSGHFSGLVTGGCQLGLFGDTEKEARLLLAMDRVSGRFGKKATRKGK